MPSTCPQSEEARVISHHKFAFHVTRFLGMYHIKAPQDHSVVSVHSIAWCNRAPHPLNSNTSTCCCTTGSRVMPQQLFQQFHAPAIQENFPENSDTQPVGLEKVVPRSSWSTPIRKLPVPALHCELLRHPQNRGSRTASILAPFHAGLRESNPSPWTS